jgi:hypothetical protein
MNDEPNVEEVKPAEPAVKTPRVDPLAEIKKKLTDEEKERFFKAFLSDQPFEDEVVVFHGKLKIKFHTLNVAQNNAVLTQQRYDLEAGMVRTDDSYVIQVIQYRLAASLISINDEPFCPSIDESTPTEKNTTYLMERVEEMKKWQMFKLSNITDAFNGFEVKVVALTEESFKENF